MILLKIDPSVESARLKMRNKRNIKIFIIAGEVSGDCLGGRIMRAMPDAEFVGVGGENMVAAGLSTLFPMSDLAVMGAIEVLAHAKTLTHRIRQTVDAIIAEKPDVVLTIDSPGFAKSVIKMLRKKPAGRDMINHGLRFHHVVAPQVWAWRPGRAKKYAKIFDKLYAFFDFETPFFTKYGLDTIAVGHPIADGIVGKYTANQSQSNDKIITLIPGSRMSEVKRLMPIMRDVTDMLNRCGFIGYKFVIPTVETTDEYIRNEISNWNVKPTLVPASVRYDTYARTYIAIAASGTVSAELAMMHVPAVIIYRMNPVTTWLVRQIIRVRWVSLVNILLGRGVYPELLGDAATAQNVFDAVCQLTIPSVRNKMISDLAGADKLWRRDAGDAAELIATDIRHVTAPAR